MTVYRFAAFALGTLITVACTDSGSDGRTSLSGTKTLTGVDLSAYLDCAREQGATLLQAHRAGPRAGAAENSIRAINASLADGAVFVEIDVARTKDGVLILMHDDTLDRTTTATGAVADVVFADLSGHTLVDPSGRDTGEPMRTLREALAALEGRGIAQLDRKGSTPVDDMLRVVQEEGATDRVMVITYSTAQAIAVHQRLPGVMISTAIRSAEDLATLKAAGVPPDRLLAWLGLGTGDPAWDAQLAAMDIETSYGDFRAERNGRADYRVMAANGAEVISVDKVAAAAHALDASESARALGGSCGTQPASAY